MINKFFKSKFSEGKEYVYQLIESDAPILGDERQSICESVSSNKLFSILVLEAEDGEVLSNKFVYDVSRSLDTAVEIVSILCQKSSSPENVIDIIEELI